MDTREAAERWRTTWERCWQSHEPDPIVALYADGAYFQTHPFRDPQAPRDYIEPTLAAEASATCEFGEPLVDGDRAAVEWHAETVLKDGGTEKLAGVSVLRFDADGLVVEQRDFWGGFRLAGQSKATARISGSSTVSARQKRPPSLDT